MKNRNTIEFLDIWEEIHNPNFNYGEFAIIKSQAGLNSYKISVKEWVEKTNAIGIMSKAGRYGGTYAHKDIAFEFGMWISPKFNPLSRAADTAKAIAAATGLPARCEPRLREQCFGKYEGTPRDGAEFRISKTHFADRYDGGESMMQLAQRIYNLLDELKADTGKTYLLVAHNGIARVVHSYFYDMTNEEYAAAGIKNCQLVEYTFE